MKKIIFILTICFLAGMSDVVLANDDSVKLIQRAYEEGNIDYQTALNYKVYAIFKRDRLPRAYHSGIPIKSATPVMLEAKDNQHLLYQENAFILYRPTDSNDSDYYGRGISVWTYDSPGGNFKIHYTEDNSRGDAVEGYDGNQSTIPQYVIDLASYFDNVWTKQITNMGYTSPPSDGSAGGDGRFDVYIMDLSGAYGYTSYDTSPSNVYIVIENDFSGFPKNLDPEGSQKGAMKVTAAHEFFHASQFQYTLSSTNYWWMEATSTWMEDALYPDVNDYLNYIGQRYDDSNDNGAWDSGETYYNIDGTTAGTTGRDSTLWFDHPDNSLNTYNGIYEYGTVIWAKYLSERYGNDVIKSVWTRIGDGSTAISALSSELSSRSTSLSSTFGLFEVANYKKDYVDGSYYPIIKHTATYTSYPQSLSGTLKHLSARFYAFKPDSSDSTLRLTFNNMNSSNLAVKLILKKADGSYEEQDVSISLSTVTKDISNFGTASTYSKVIMIVMNTSSSQDGLAYSVSADKAGQTSDSSGGGGGCFIATAAFGSYLAPEVKILRKFRDAYLISNFKFRISNFKIEIPNYLGRAFVKSYYRFSPPVADYISGHEGLRLITRLTLTPVVYGLKYPLLFLVLVGFPIGIGIIKRRF
jgi:hypothetical protein